MPLRTVKIGGMGFTRDRISDLPDQLLTRVLSLLPAKEVVRTCVLSKRWTRVWASVPVLDFCNGLTWQMSDEEIKEASAKFITFVTNVLNLRETLPLDTFKLIFWGKHRSTPVSKLLRGVASFTPRVMFIHITSHKIFKLPDSIFTCASIEEMTLKIQLHKLGEYCFKPKSICLPSLKKLELARHVAINENFMRMLLAGSPDLEELILDYCHMYANEISSPVLKKLRLTNFYQETAIQISCPAAVYLQIYSHNAGGIILKNMSSLVQAEICFDDVDMFQIFADHDLELLGGLSNVTTLRITTSCPKVLDLLVADIPNCQTFKNLKNLDLGLLDANYHWDLVACFLKHSPHLKKLSMFCIEHEDLSKEVLPENVVFQRDYLETVKITCPEKTAKITFEVERMLCALIKTIEELDFE